MAYPEETLSLSFLVLVPPTLVLCIQRVRGQKKNYDMHPNEQVKILLSESWVRDRAYRDLFDTRHMDDHCSQFGYWEEEIELSISDQFLVSFAEEAEFWKKKFTFREFVRERISVTLSPRIVDNLSSFLWSYRETDQKLDEFVARELETRISMIMRCWWSANYPRELEDGPILRLPNVNQQRSVVDVISIQELTTRKIESHLPFFGMSAPMIRPLSKRGYLSYSLRCLMRKIKLEDRLPDVNWAGIDTDVHIELAYELSVCLQASPYVSMRAAEYIFSYEGPDPENTIEDLCREME